MARTNKLVFHFYSEGNPDNLLPFFRAVQENDIVFDHVKDMTEFAQEYGINSPKQWNVLPEQIKLIIRNGQNKLTLSSETEILLKLSSQVQVDIIHFIIYTTWQADKPNINVPTWTYRQMVDYLWQMGQIDNLSERGHQIAEEIYNTSLITFAEVAEYDPSQVSFGSKSILGVRKWLERLYPVVVSQDNFKRRLFCAPELMLLALGWVGQTMQGELEIDFLLTPPRREAICRLCLLEPNALDAVLDWTLPRYSQVIQPGTSAGTYGRFLRFLKWPQFVDL